MEQASASKDIFQCDVMDLCQCGRDKAIFFCKKKECPNNQKQRFYCMECSENPSKHDHANVRVITEIKVWNDKWVAMKDELQTLST
jgi:hypothetical protein